jgi:hypothetical protein
VISRRQSGVVSLRQALGAGLSRRAAYHRVSRGQWRQPHPRVFQIADGDLTDAGRVWAAALWARPRVAVTGLAAAWWHGLAVECPDVIEVTVARDRQPRAARPDVRIRRRDLADTDLVHSGADRFRADRRRQNALVLAGWTVLRFTWDDLVHRPAHVLTEIREALGDQHLGADRDA